MKGRITKTGYRRNSPDVNNDFNIIPSNRISMKGVDFPVLGIDNLGNTQLMHPGGEYEYQGDYVTELPMYGSGGLTQWFAEEWVDIKTGKKCGRSGKDKKGRPYPACRPSKRVNKTTPKTASELSAAEKAKFKRKKKSGKRIDYNHKRAQEGTEVPLNRSEVFNIPRTLRYENGNMVLQDKPVWDGMLDEVTITPYTQSEIAFQELMNNKATGGLEPVYPVFEVLSAGIKTPFTASAKALQTGVRKAPSVINPRYFKPNSNMYYRGIGKKGMEDALQSGLFRAKPADQIPARMVDLGSVGKVDMAKRFNKTYYSPRFNIADQYGAGYIAEVPKDAAKFSKRYKNTDWSMSTREQIPVSKGRILEKNWWSGYKPVKKYGGSLPKAQEGNSEAPLNRGEIFNIPRTMGYEDGKMVVQDKPIWDGMLDEVTITPYTQGNILSEYMMNNKATGGLEPVYPVFDLMTLGLKAPATAGVKAIQAGIKKAPSKLNPKYYNPNMYAKGNPNVMYRQVGKDAYQDFANSGFVRTKAEITDNPILGLLETQKEIKDVLRYNKEYRPSQYRHATDFRAPFFSRGKTTTIKDGGADYLIQTRPDKVGPNNFYSAQWNILHGDQPPVVGGFGIMDPMYRAADNFDVFKKSWWHGYKPVKQLGGSLTKYQVQGEVFPTMLDEVTVIDKGAPSAFGKGSSDRMGTTYTIPMNIKNARGYSQNGMRVLFDSPGKLAKDAQKEFRSQFGFNANKLKKNFKNIFSQDFITLGDDQTFQNAAYAGPMSLSNSYFINESDNIIEPRTISRSNTKVTTNLINNDRSALLADMARPGTKADFFNLFQQREGFRPYLEAKVSNGKVYDAKLGEEDVTSRSPFESNMINYLGSDAYFERLAGTQYNNEIDVNKWSTDKDYRKSYAERLKADKPEFLKNYYEGLSKTLANPIVAEIDHNLGSYASAGTHNHGTLTGQNVIDYNPYNFNNAFGGAEKRKEALIKELERRGATPAEIDVTMEYGIGPGMNDNFSDVMSHELAHVYSLGSKDYILNNESANVAPGIDKEYELLWNINKDTKDQPFYSYQNHLNTGSKPISYNTALNSEIQNVADRLNTRYHNISPEETKADVYGIRNYLLRTQGQDYDQPFTKENYDSLMNDDKFKEGLFYKRMQERYGDDQSKWMKAMNLIASKEDGKNYRMYAERGGQLPKAQKGNGEKHTVASGETFYGIANKNGIAWEDLVSANPGVDIEKLSVGQIINIPSVSKSGGVKITYSDPELNILQQERELGNIKQSEPEQVEQVKITKQPVETKTTQVYDGPGYFPEALLLKQAYKESTFNPAAQSKIKDPAQGFAQFRPITVRELQRLGFADDTFDPFDYTQSIGAQRDYMNYLYTRPWIDKPNQSEEVRLAKTLAAYNWGPEVFKTFLTNKKAAGVDIYNSLDWVDQLPGETGDYINKILLDSDEQFQADYQKALKDSANLKYINLYNLKAGGESLPVYNTYKTKNRAWLAARKNLGANKKFMYGGKVYSTSTPKGL